MEYENPFNIFFHFVLLRRKNKSVQLKKPHYTFFLLYRLFDRPVSYTLLNMLNDVVINGRNVIWSWLYKDLLLAVKGFLWIKKKLNDKCSNVYLKFPNITLCSRYVQKRQRNIVNSENSNHYQIPTTTYFLENFETKTNYLWWYPGSVGIWTQGSEAHCL